MGGFFGPIGPPFANGVPAAGSNTQIQYNNNGVLGASAKLTWNDSAQQLIIGANSGGNFFSGAADSPFTFNINTTTSGLSPGLTFVGANASADAASRAGGAVTIKGGNGGTGIGGGPGGACSINAGNAQTNGNGGAVNLAAGAGSAGASGSGGSIGISGGTPGGATTANGSSFTVSGLNAGATAATTANGGGVTLTAGNGGASATTAAGGNVSITAGTHGASSSSADGHIALTTAGGTTTLAGGGILLPVFTVGTLPSAVTFAGYTFRVSDASSPTWNGVLTGGGSTPCLAFSDGTNWRAG